MKRVLILDSPRGSEDILAACKMIIEKNNLADIEIAAKAENYFRHLPEGYDLYIVHLSNTSEDALLELKKNQPWCKIFIISGSLTEKPDYADGLYYIINSGNIEELLDRLATAVILK